MKPPPPSRLLDKLGSTKELRRAPTFLELQARFGERLASLRRLRGWTQHEAAGKLGIGWRHLQKVEAGEVNITLLLLYRFGVVYGVSVDTLFSDESVNDASSETQIAGAARS